MNVRNRIESTFLEAVRCALWNRSPDLGIFEGLKTSDWKALYMMAFQHNAEAFCGSVFSFLPNDLIPEQGILHRWLVRMKQVEEANKTMNKAISELNKLFTAHGLFPVLQKGQGIAQYYEQPLLRSSGDVDWYFGHKENYLKASVLMKKQGKDFRYHSNYSCGYNWGTIAVEHHQKLLQVRNPFKQKYLRGLIHDRSHFAKSFDFEGTKVYVPEPFLNSLMINIHVLSHQVGYGLGIKQFCDAARLYYSEDLRPYGAQLQEVYTQIGVIRWVHAFHQVLVDMLGLSEDKLPFALLPDTKVDWMIVDILKGGNFSFYDQQYDDLSIPGGRVNRFERLFYGFKKYLPLAPLETISFPLIQVISKVHR